MGLDSVKDIASWGALIGVLLPLLIAVVNQPRWSAQQKQLAAITVSAVAGVGTVITSGNFDPQNWVVTLAAVIGAAQAAYALLWKPTKIAPSIETKTSSGGGEAGAVSLFHASLVLVVLGLILLLFTTLGGVGWVLIILGALIAVVSLVR